MLIWAQDYVRLSKKFPFAIILKIGLKYLLAIILPLSLFSFYHLSKSCLRKIKKNKWKFGLIIQLIIISYILKQMRKIIPICISGVQRDYQLDPGLAFQKILKQKAYSIILTSGTLTPFYSWECELRMPFPVQINNSHVIDTRRNIIAGILKKGIKTEFNFSFKNRQNDELYIELGEVLLQFCNPIPNGILVVFSSYQLLNKCRFIWAKNQKLLTRLQSSKSLFWEQPDSSEFQDMFQQFQKVARTSKGAIIFGVCKGKIAEGIDLNDELCRAVFVIGIPYPPAFDIKVKLKQEYLDKIANDPKLNHLKRIKSSEWYKQQAIRATNQAIGRVIRHINDYGAIYLIDSRFQQNDLKSELSAWVLPVIQQWNSFEEGFKATESFFASKGNQEYRDARIQKQKLFEEEDENIEEISNKKRDLLKPNNFYQKVEIKTQVQMALIPKPDFQHVNNDMQQSETKPKKPPLVIKKRPQLQLNK